jgi:3-deoxy-D-manno-octulosonate 8-phosphate phosphatase (KDO 8-P phosphatase)
MESVEQHFIRLGAQIVTPATEIAGKVKTLRGLIFDWDGVFNAGIKGEGQPSSFSEADSMGTNMLRFGLWRFAENLPICALISGADNPGAVQFARREHFDAVYLGIRDKQLALDHLLSNHGLAPELSACFFDDINDVPMARRCGIRCLINRPASPLFKAFARQRRLCDYITGSGSGNHAVREAVEFLLGVADDFDAVVESRAAFDESYREYFSRRQSVRTRYYRQEHSGIVADSGN